jgi:SOS-response transcriptional repressor LexA
MRGHQLADMELRAFIVRAWLLGMPTAVAKAAAPPKASITAENVSTSDCMGKWLPVVANSVNTARGDSGATLCSVSIDRKKQGERLRAVRIAAGYRSAREAALQNGWPESTYRAHESGSRTIGLDDAERYARRFAARGVQITAQSILFGASGQGFAEPQREYDSGTPVPPGPPQANTAEPSHAASQLSPADVPPGAFADLGRGNFFALRVLGDSMDRISPHNSVIIVNRSEHRLVSGGAYVISLRGEQIYRYWKDKQLVPFSTNPSHQPITIKNPNDLTVFGRVRRTVSDL